MLRPPVVRKDDATSLSCAETLVVVEEERNTDREISIPREVKLTCLGSLAGLLNGFFGIGEWL